MYLILIFFFNFKNLELIVEYKNNPLGSFFTQNLYGFIPNFKFFMRYLYGNQTLLIKNPFGDNFTTKCIVIHSKDTCRFERMLSILVFRNGDSVGIYLGVKIWHCCHV